MPTPAALKETVTHLAVSERDEIVIIEIQIAAGLNIYRVEEYEDHCGPIVTIKLGTFTQLIDAETVLSTHARADLGYEYHLFKGQKID